MAAAAPPRPTGFGSAATTTQPVQRSRHALHDGKPEVPSHDRLHSTARFIAAPPVPITPKQRDERGEETRQRKVFFRSVPVFDVSMTDPLPGKEPIPLTPPSQPITGDSHHHLIAPLIAHAGTLDYTVEIRELPDNGPGGWCDPKRKQIVIAAGPANRQVRTLVHEIAHAHGLGYTDYGRKRCEVLVDCVTYCVLGSVGLDVGGESIPYIAGWGEDGALDAIREYAHTIDTIARRIEDALATERSPDSKPNVPEPTPA